MSTQLLYTSYPYPVKYCELDHKIRIAYMDEGTGPQTVLMIHGLGSYAPSWSQTIHELKSHVRCVALDLPNYGQSSKGNYPVNMNWFVQILQEFILNLNLGPVILAGHSMGGQIALWADHLKLFPIEKLMLLAPAGFEQFSHLERRMFSMMNATGLMRNMPDAQIALNYEASFYSFPENAQFMLDDRLALKKNHKAFNHYTKMVAQCSIAMLEQPVYDILPEVTLPVQVIFGLQDGFIPNRVLHRHKTTEEIAWEGTKRMPNARLRLIPEAGHFVHWEKSEACNTTLIAFAILN